MLTDNAAVQRFDDLELGLEQRRHRRYRVNLPVRFRGSDVVAHAENLSRGGLFVRGSYDLERDSEVELTVELPGYRAFELVARVAHIRTASQASSWGGTSGVGLEITDSEAGFDFALLSYLHKLGMRSDSVVLCADLDARRYFDSAGYCAVPLPAPGEIAGLGAPVLAVIAPVDLHDAYLEVGGFAVLDAGLGTEQLLGELDAGLESRRLQSWR